VSGGLVLGGGSGIAGAVLREAWQRAGATPERWLLTVRPGSPHPDLEPEARGRELRWRHAEARDEPAPFLESAGADGWRPERVLVAWGTMLAQGPAAEQDLRGMNGTAVLRWLDALADWLPAGARVAVLGSVAGDRPRPSLGGYALGKQDLERGVVELRRRHPALRWTLVKPGPVATPMTAALARRPPLMVQPAVVAPRIVRAWDAGSPVVYAPSFWRAVSLVLGLVPGPLYRRLPI
jgi:decaprenylphospho-beta-D-erythro-pentofuranosid-2-ulose 2-reductase